MAAVPYTPVGGRRLLYPADSPELAGTLAAGVQDYARAAGVSSLHWLFTAPEDDATLADGGLLRRTGCQFHWYNRDYADFDHYLARFTARERKKVRSERRAVAAQGVTVEMLSGGAADRAAWDSLYRFYLDTFEKKGNYAPLSRAFFAEIAVTLGDRILLILARHAGEYVAGALFFIGGDTLYGRHWGGREDFRQLHFELCYYAAIEYCIAHGLRRFEAGAQGEYKVRRGFEPTPTHSFHWLADAGFRAAVGDFLVRETQAMENYRLDMQRQLPFKDSEA